MRIWGRRIPGRGSFRCKGPEAAACLVHSSACEEGSVAATPFNSRLTRDKGGEKVRILQGLTEGPVAFTVSERAVLSLLFLSESL